MKGKYPQIIVEWEDIWSNDDWINEDDLDEWLKDKTLVYARGWLVAEDTESIIIALQYTNDGGLSLIQRIPRRCINSMTIIDDIVPTCSVKKEDLKEE